MKKMMHYLVFITLLFSFTNIFAAPEKFTLDHNHTYVLWHANHFGFSSPSGKWMANGTLILDKEDPAKSSVKVTINMADLSTGFKEFDDHLKAKLFFDVAHFPTATFVSNKVIPQGDDAAIVEGMLTLHGVTKPVTLNVKLNKVGMSVITNKMTAGFTASTTIKRSDFGMTSFLPGVGDDVKIEIEAEAYKS